MAAKTRRNSRKTAARAVTPARAFATLQADARKVIQSSAQQVVARALGARDAVLARADAARQLVTARAATARSRTTKAATRLERAFEQRISSVVTKLGVPSAKDVRVLSRQVAELQASVNQLRRSRARAS
jgi:poly(hydroxyalkanoate) granule-associated protein